VYLVLLFLGYFTFFGNLLAGEMVAKAQAKSEKIRVGYRQAEERTRNLLTAAVQQKLYDQIDRSQLAPRAARIIERKDAHYSDMPFRRKINLTALSNKYASAKNSGKVTLSKDLDERIRRKTSSPSNEYKEPKRVVYTSEPEPKPDQGQAPFFDNDPGRGNISELTVERVEQVNEKLGKLEESFGSVVVAKLPDSSEVLVQLPKTITAAIKSHSAGYIETTTGLPFIDPMIGWVVSVFDKSIEEKIKAKITPRLDAIIKKWFKGGQIGKEEFLADADEIVAASNLRVPTETVETVEGASTDLEKDISEINGLISQLDDAIKKESEALVQCWCTCSRDHIPRYLGKMKASQCHAACRDGAPC
jgi:hypothetical protein